MSIDHTPFMALAVCPCGWRYAALDAAEARRADAIHKATECQLQRTILAASTRQQRWRERAR